MEPGLAASRGYQAALRHGLRRQIDARQRPAPRRDAPELLPDRSALSNQRAQGMPGARCARRCMC
jgi:hypothetical protein